jgi:L-lactate dehydrogenase complex protein LldF
VVHWAADAQEHNEIVHGLLAARGVRHVVKSKSMLTEECGLNPYLEERGIEVVDTDLGERIVQLRDEAPSHIVMPAIHLRREDVGSLFARQLGTPPGETDPIRLTEAARQHLRAKFLNAGAGITGVNFAVAEDGALVVCTNEGNADLGTALPDLHIACMGIEKIVPRLADLAVFLRLLARSATGQAITTYTSHYRSPRRGQELHVVLVDNGRSALLANEHHRSALQCIRCGACLNTCPVYHRSGGHSYGVTVAGPIGSVLAPAKDAAAHGSLPYACSLCGSCSEVCPAKVDLHDQLLAWRRELVEGGHSSQVESAAMSLLGRVLANPRAYRTLGKAARLGLRWLPDIVARRLPDPWSKHRDLPSAPSESFTEQWRARRGN